jgi:hypothetical protein
MTTQHDDRIVVETPASKRRRLVLMAIIATGLPTLLVTARPYGDFGLVIGTLALVVFVPVTVVFLLRAIRNRPVLVLDAEGFTDRGSVISAGHVSWQEVQRIEEKPAGRRVFVAVTVNDRDAFRARQSAWHRLLLRLNGPMVAGDILIPDSVLPMSPAELVKTMRRLHRQAVGRAPRGGTNRRA